MKGRIEKYLQIKIWLFLLSFGVSLALFAQGPSQQLQAKDVRIVMERLFEYHIEDHEMSTELMDRSVRLYVEAFDPEKLYLSQEDFDRLVDKKPQELKQMVAEYQKDDLATYRSLDQSLSDVIMRSRKWRQEIYGQREALFKKALDKNLPVMTFSDLRPTTEQALKERLENFIASFVADQQSLLSSPLSEDDKTKILAFCEQEFRYREEAYLGLTSEGQALPSDQITSQLVMRVLKAEAKSLDAHTAYFSPEDAQDMRMQLEEGVSSGVGIVVRQSVEGMVILRLMPGGAAEKSGKIFPKDRIVEIDGHSIVNVPFADAIKALRGQAGTSLTLGVIHSGQVANQVVQVKLQRAALSLDVQKIETSFIPVEGGIIGKISLHVFYEDEDGKSASNDIKEAIAKFEKEGKLKGLVLDLRDNPGGFLNEAVKVTGLFIESGIVVIAEYGSGKVRYLRDLDPKVYFEGPMVVLTSRMSASASEIVAQALQDYGAALVVGDVHTFGKGSIQYQTVTDQDAETLYKVTVGRYYTPSGRSTQLQGVLADIVVPTASAKAPISEACLEFPISSHNIAPAFQDKLADVPSGTRVWYDHYYLPYLQARRTEWRQMLPTLQEKSQERLAANPEFQELSKKLAAGDYPARVYDHAGNMVDVQMEEAVDIVKDMIALEARKDFSGKTTSLNKDHEP